ncbi:MAG: hypothetical protein ACYC8V_05995 [Caulobacteraceae bacterium]
MTLKSQSGDGTSCVYRDPEGAEVDLQLVKLGGTDPQNVLAPIENALKTELPPAGASAAAPAGHGDHDRVDINLPGVHIHANENGSADVQAAGVNVNASGQGAANVLARGVTVNANQAGAQIRVNDAGPGVRSTFLLVSDVAGPHGYKFVGYEARGPDSGPLAIAQFKGRGEDHDDLDHEVKRLLDRNVGK